MKVKILAGLVTALIYGNTAMAQDVDDKNTDSTQGQTSPDNFGGSGLDDTTQQDDLIILDQEDVAPVPVPDTGLQDEGVGGSGLEDQDAIGGSGQTGQPVQPKASIPVPGIPVQGQGGMTLYCTPVPGQATGGSGAPQGDEQSSLQPDSGAQTGAAEAKPSDVPAAPVAVEAPPSDEAFGGSGYEVQADQGQKKGDMRGVTVLVGAGVEGYTGGLAPEINPGATVGVTANLRPSKVLGLELGYSGAVNNLDTDVGGSGPDIVRNGAVANLTLGLTAATVQPYLLGGFGMNWYNVRNGQSLGFTDDTNSRIPVGLGLRSHIGHFTADARINYNILLSEDFAPSGVSDEFSTGSYQGTLNLGGTF